MNSTPDRSRAVPSLEALKRDIALADRRAGRRTAITVSALAVLVLLILLGAAYAAYMGLQGVEEGLVTDPPVASSQDGSLFLSRGGYLVDSRSKTPIKPLVKELILVASFSANGHIALTTEGPYTPSYLATYLFRSILFGGPGRQNSDEVLVFDSSGEQIASFRTGVAPEALMFSPDSNRLLAVPKEGAASIWNLQGQFVTTIKMEEPISLATFFPNSSYVLAVPEKGAPTVWNLHGQLVSTIRMEGRIQFLAFSPDSESIVVATPDGTLLLWDIPNNQMVQRINGPKALATVVGFRPDGQQIAVVYEAPAQVKFWDVGSGREVSSEFRWTEAIHPFR